MGAAVMASTAYLKSTEINELAGGNSIVNQLQNVPDLEKLLDNPELVKTVQGFLFGTLDSMGGSESIIAWLSESSCQPSPGFPRVEENLASLGKVSMSEALVHVSKKLFEFP